MSELVALDRAAAELLAEVHAEAFDHPWNAADLAEMIGGPAAHLLAARDGDDLLGFILFQAIAGEAEILTLAVRSGARRRGTGRTLVEGAAIRSADLGAQVLWLEVAADNAAALGLYRGAGFEEAGRRVGYYRVGPGRHIDAIVMRRALNTAPASLYSS